MIAPVLPAARISEEARIWLASLLERAPRDPAILAVVATGSAIRPVERSQDLDLFILHSVDRPSLRPTPPIDVDLRYQPQHLVEQAIAEGNEYVVWALTHGVPLFEREAAWRRLVERWQGALPLPRAERSISRARRASRYAAELRRMGDLEAAEEQHLSMLTHLAWARLLAKSILPVSRPELPEQLRRHGEVALADELQRAVESRPDPAAERDDNPDGAEGDRPRLVG